MSARRFALAALLLVLSACHHDGDAELLVVVTASGSPPAVAALNVTLVGPAGMSMNRYTRDDNQPITFPTTLSARLPVYATGTLSSIDVDAQDAAGASVASGHGGPVTVHAAERKMVYVQLDCRGGPCVVDGGAGDSDGGIPPSPHCGNGRVDKDETCDTAIAAGDPGACPASCDDHVACTKDTMTGSDCTLSCAHEPITSAQPGDGCCPANNVAMDDSDCSPTCGDGVVDPGETCDTKIPRGSPGACPSNDDCAAGAPCASNLLVSAGTCSAVCLHYPIVAQTEGDGCCPPGATHEVDGDCPIVCGNGIVEASETCDIGIAPLRPGACPASCPTTDPCKLRVLTGSGCQSFCREAFTITAPLSGDGCCPSDPVTRKPLATQVTDSDCAPICGNGVVERGEACDGASCPTSCPPTPSACLRAALVGDAADCTAHCVVTEVTECSLEKDGCCPAGCTSDNDGDCSNACGDGFVSATQHEVCDIAVPPGKADTCPTSCADAKACTQDLLVSAGTCAAACMYLPITSFRPGDGCCAFAAGANFTLDPDCAPVCGNGVVESPAESCDFAVSGSCPAPDAGSCPPSNVCTRYVVKGTMGACSATCVALPTTACMNGDQCCPPGCNAANDSDCPVVCGDGVVETGESCDRGITAGVAGACPRSCDDGDACTTDLASGSTEGCTRTCVHLPITGCVSGDGCCAPGCSVDADHDCAPRCGDGQIGAGETCDPPSSCPTTCPDDGDPCTAEQLTGDAASCTAVCRHLPITACSGATAGDGCCPTGCIAANDFDCP